jgi:hypothetical protein
VASPVSVLQNMLYTGNCPLEVSLQRGRVYVKAPSGPRMPRFCCLLNTRTGASRHSAIGTSWPMVMYVKRSLCSSRPLEQRQASFTKRSLAAALPHFLPAAFSYRNLTHAIHMYIKVVSWTRDCTCALIVALCYSSVSNYMSSLISCTKDEMRLK